jgi:hypothetical protein
LIVVGPVPILPLDYPEPFAATLGVMLYPRTDNDDPSKARAFAARWLAIPLSRYHEAGHRLPYEALARIAEGSSATLADLHERFWGGTATGELVKTLRALANSDPRCASWNNAVKVFCIIAKRRSAKGSRTDLLEAKRRFVSVAHLWGAWSIREGQFKLRPDLGYDGYQDFQSFLTEAEIIRRWGQKWRPTRARSSPLFPADMWRPPETWIPPTRHSNWPDTGRIPGHRLPGDLLRQLRPAGRPRRS